MNIKIKISNEELIELFDETVEETGVDIRRLLKDNPMYYQYCIRNMMAYLMMGGYDITFERLDKVFRAYIGNMVDGSKIEIWDENNE